MRSWVSSSKLTSETISSNYVEFNKNCAPKKENKLSLIYFLARDSMLRAHMLSAARLSLRLSVSRVDQSKKVEVRMMQLSPQSSPMTLIVSARLTSQRNSKENIKSGSAE